MTATLVAVSCVCAFFLLLSSAMSLSRTMIRVSSFSSPTTWRGYARTWQRSAAIRAFSSSDGSPTNGQVKPTKSNTRQRRIQSDSNAPQQTLEELRQVRLDKVAALKAAGLTPYAYSFAATHSTTQLQQQFAALPAGSEDSSANVSIAGRVMLRRTFGKLAFFTLQDGAGVVQLYLDKARLGDAAFEQLRDLSDAGDIIGVHGSVKRTDKGELSVYVSQWQMLTKSLLPLPDKFHGLTDVNTRYRQRHLDLIVNPHVRQTFRQRAQIISQLRSVLDGLGYLEVETPILQTQPGGAEAKPFETFHHALDTPMTLRIATELHLKRLVVGGLDRVYEIGRIFRNEGVSTRHNPEFTSVELYCAYADHEDMMRLAETMVADMARRLHGEAAVVYQGTRIDLAPPWRRASMSDLVRDATGVDFYPFVAAGDVAGAKAAALALASDASHAAAVSRDALRECETAGEVLNALFEALVEQTLVQPTFVTEHPIDISPLAKPHRAKAGVTERFELFVVGREHANAFSELTDACDQRRRFEAQAAKKARGDEEACDVDEDFLAALETGLPPTAGMGIGIDRLVMLLTDAPAIRDVIAFPTLRPERPPAK